MAYYPRLLESKVKELFKAFPVICVQGARQTGKSTMVEKLFGSKVKTITFDPISDIGNARRDPDFFLENFSPPLFLDEIQYVPELLPALKRKVDQEKKNGLYIISGSQNLGVLKNISESLAGRVGIINLYPMSQKELSKKTSSYLISHLQEKVFKANLTKPKKTLLESLWRGGYPKIIQSKNTIIPDYYESYIQTYIERDIRLFGNIQSLPNFRKFLAILSALSGTEINYSELGRELGLDGKTIKAWTSLAEISFQWTHIYPYYKNPLKRISKKPKGFYTDTGLICALQKIPSPDSVGSHPYLGRLFETFVFNEIHKTIQVLPYKPGMFHYRTHAGAEVDIILEYDGKLFPIEVKLTSHPSPSDTSGIQSFIETYPKENIAHGLVVCSVNDILPISKTVTAIPYWMI